MAAITPMAGRNFAPNSRRSMPLYHSPKIRKSIGSAVHLTPVGQGERNLEKLINSAGVEFDCQNNDEAELRERQRQRAAELQQQNLASPSTPVDRRKSMGVATGMTNAALAEHYANCIKLSAENKINMKNAFNLQLIDCMSEMLRKKDPEMNNFQAASCTLDASTKIYAYRVDCVHIDTLKMAGGLGRTGNEEHQEQENAQGNDGETENATKKKARKKNKKTIETNIETLNLSKFDTDYDVDPLFKKNSAMFDEGRNGGVNFLTSLNIKDDGCQLVLDSDSLCNSSIITPDPSQKCCIGRLSGLEDAEICPSLKGFSFTTWNPKDDDILGRLQSPAKRKLDDYQVPELPAPNEDHAFDMDAVPDAVDADDSFNDTHLGMEDIDEDEGGIDRQRNADHQPNPLRIGASKELGIVELRDQLSALPQEYSYFGATARSAWAGPLHWKFKHASRQVDANARETKKKRRKEPLTLDFDAPMDFANAFNPARNTSKLTTTTLVQWLPEKITLPEDLHFDIKEFTQSFVRPLVSVRAMNNVRSSQDVEDVLSPYDYANRRDAENFCPVVNPESDSDYDDPNDPGMTFNAFGDQTEFISQPEPNNVLGQFTGDNLVAAPNMVAKIQINYAKVAKKMDMRRLKSTMWTMLNNNPPAQNQADSAPPQQGKPFTTTYRTIPTLLPQKMAENLSVALAFAALLHLANENCLHLEQQYGDLSDFKICHTKQDQVR